MNTKYQALDLMKCIQGKYEHKIPGLDLMKCIQGKYEHKISGSGFNEMYSRKV